MKRKPQQQKTGAEVENLLLHRLTHLTKQVSLANYAQAKALFELTKTSTYPKAITDMAEAFGMMIVKVESREFRLEQLVEELEGTCRELSIAKKTLAAFSQTLERQVNDRTEKLNRKNSELALTLQILKKEMKERKLAERNLQQLYKQLEETNRKLLDAYLWMKQRKDQLSARQYTESVVFLVDDGGRILGVTENAISLTRKSRSALNNATIEDILTLQEDRTWQGIFHQVRPRVSFLTTVKLRDASNSLSFYEAKLTRVAVDGKRLISVVLHEPVDK